MSKALTIGTLLLLASGLAAARGDNDGKIFDSGRSSREVRFGRVATAPEMEIASAGAALALLAGGIIVLRGRKNSKKD